MKVRENCDGGDEQPEGAPKQQDWWDAVFEDTTMTAERRAELLLMCCHDLCGKLAEKDRLLRVLNQAARKTLTMLDECLGKGGKGVGA